MSKERLSDVHAVENVFFEQGMKDERELWYQRKRIDIPIIGILFIIIMTANDRGNVGVGDLFHDSYRHMTYCSWASYHP